MTETEHLPFLPPIPLPREVREKLDAFVEHLLSALPDHARALEKELKATDEMAERVRERIKRGSRRTSGKLT